MFWADMVAKAIPLAESWEQERWDIELAPCYGKDDEEEDDAADANSCPE